MSDSSRERDRAQPSQDQSTVLNDPPTIKQLYEATVNGDIDLMKLLITSRVNPFEIYSTNMFDLYKLSSLPSSIKNNDLPPNNSLFFASVVSNSTLIIDYVIDYSTSNHIRQSLLQYQQHHHQTKRNNDNNDEINQIKTFAFIIGAITNKFNSLQHLTTKYNITLDDTTMMKYLPYILQRGHIEITQYLFQHHNITQFFNTTTYPHNDLFYHIVKSGHIELVKYIINRGDIVDDINQLNELEQPPLYIAAVGFHWDIVRFLIESNATPESVLSVLCEDEDQFSLLHHAVRDVDVPTEFIDYLINDIGIDVDSTTDSLTTPILIAASNANLGILQHLVEKHNADVHVFDSSGSNLFHYATFACGDCTPELISCIHSYDVEIQDGDSLNGPPIDLAIQNCGADAVQEFINFGAEISISINNVWFVYDGVMAIIHDFPPGPDNIGVLTKAMYNDDDEVIELLMGWFFNDFLQHLTRDDIDSLIALLLQKAFEFGDFNMFGTIYSNYSDYYISHDNFLQILATSKYIKPYALSTLIDLFDFDLNNTITIEIDSTDETTTASTLCAAVYNPSNSLELIQLIIDRGVNINSRTENGYNAIHFLLCRQSVDKIDKRCEILHYLINLGVDTTTISTKSETQVHIAAKNSPPELLSILIDHHIDQLLESTIN